MALLRKRAMTGRLCRAARAGLRLDLGDLADEAGLDRDEIEDFEEGVANLTIVEVTKITDALRRRRVFVSRTKTGAETLRFEPKRGRQPWRQEPANDDSSE